MRRALVLVLLVGVAAAASAAWHWTPTFDEPQHLEMGRRILQEGDWSRFDNSKMPVSALNAAAWLLASGVSEPLRWWLARLPQLLWLVGTAWLVHRWARRHHPPAAALGAAALVAWDPNLQAHGALVTTDLPCTFFVLASAWATARALRSPGWRRWCAAGLVVGLALAAKFTTVLVVPILGLVAAGWCLLARSRAPLKGLWAAPLAALLALNAAYGFQGTGTRASEIAWRSSLLGPAASLPVPLPVPRPWIEGVDWVRSDDEQGHGNIYLDGRMTAMGQPDWMVRALAWKLPLATMGLALLGLFSLRREGLEELAILLPPAALLAFFSLFFNFQLGIRYALPVVPFLALLAARTPPTLLWGGALWVLASGLSWWPWTLSYFNERLGDRTQAWRHLADSNLDWGQAGRLAEAWRAEHPEGLVDPPVPAPGPMLVSANVLTGVLGDPVRFQCLRDHFPPREHLGYALYPYDLSAADYEACFEPVRVRGSGSRDADPLPPGDHLLLLRHRGTSALRVGKHRIEGRAEGGREHLLGLVVHAEGPWSARVETDDPQATLYLDGRELPR